MSGRVVNGDGPHHVTIDGRPVKCADINTREVLGHIAALSRTDWPYSGSPAGPGGRWVMWPEVSELYPLLPTKVVWAKCCNLIHRGFVTGCDCGCRGDMELTDRGRAFLAPPTLSPSEDHA